MGGNGSRRHRTAAWKMTGRSRSGPARRRRWGGWAGLIVAGLLAGCASAGPTDDPLQRSLGWFSYLNGDDLRADCRPGAPERYRLIFNGVFIDQVRSYDLAVDPAGGGVLRAWARTEADISAMELRDILKPWRGRVATAELDPAAVESIRSALSESGAFDPAPRGLRLPSDSFYGTVTACPDGAFRFNAFLYPSERFARLVFPAVLLRHDRTGVPYNVPRSPETPPYGKLSFPPYGESYEDGAAFNRFVLQVGDNGLTGLLRLFR